MICPKCNNKVSELDDRCLICGLNFEEYEQNLKKVENGYLGKNYGEKTFGIRFINVLQLIGFILGGIISFASEQIGKGFVCIAIGVITYFFIKGFADIIDLLDSINDKIYTDK